MWAEIAQCRVNPLAIVEHLDVFKEIVLGLGTSLVVAVMNQLGFQGTKEALHRRVIITVTGTAHAGQYAVCLE